MKQKPDTYHIHIIIIIIIKLLKSKSKRLSKIIFGHSRFIEPDYETIMCYTTYIVITNIIIVISLISKYLYNIII